ncbi:MAG: DUF1566 domain-containing protein [Desulfobacterales bacterium]
MKTTKFYITFIILTALLPISGHSWPIPDSGQTKCYDDAGNELNPCPSPGEDFYGQDGNYLINPPSYTKLDASGNELPHGASSWVMVRDNVTGLIWEVKQNKDDVQDYSNPHDADNTYTWYDSKPETNGGNAGTPGDGTDTEDFINKLNAANFGGYSDWRLPTVKELASITDLGRNLPAADIRYFPNTQTQSLGYWSSTACINNTVDAWYVYFHYGYDYTYSKSYARYVRAVRGKQSDSDFIINNDGTITDIRNGLMWQQNTGGSMTWKDSLSYCESLTLAEYSDWRLPNREELRSLTDYKRYDPAIDLSVFPDTSSSFYWTSSSCDRYRDNSWDMDFYGGYDSSSIKSENRYVRSVRGGQVRLSRNLFITSPSQASFWNSEDTMPIKWETQSISGNVKITLSRDGGKTFETITETTPNDGSYDWIVSGSPSVNCMLKIEPLNDLHKWTQQSLFTITDRVPPIGSISINNGAASTNSIYVTLSISASDTGSGLDQMQFSNDNVNWSSPAPYRTSCPWILISGEGAKTVYARFCDAAGNCTSHDITDTIQYTTLTIPPTPSGLAIDSASDGEIVLRWTHITSPSDITYKVCRSESPEGIFYPINRETVDYGDVSFGKVYYTDRELNPDTTYYYKIKSFLGDVPSVDFSAIVSAVPSVSFDFECRLLDNPARIMNIGSKIRHEFQLLPKEGFTGSLNLSCTDLPSGLSGSFFLNGQIAGSAFSIPSLPAWVTLEISSASSTPLGEHPFTLIMQNITGGSSPVMYKDLKITVIPKYEEGIHAETEKIQSFKGQANRIYGQILPPLSGKNVTLTLYAQDTGESRTWNISTVTGGLFSMLRSFPVWKLEPK